MDNEEIKHERFKLVMSQLKPIKLATDHLWGQEYWLCNEKEQGYAAKFLVIYPGAKSSLHEHVIQGTTKYASGSPGKDETFIVLSGKLVVEFHETEWKPTGVYTKRILMEKGDVKRFPANTPHRFWAEELTLLLEVSTYENDYVSKIEPSQVMEPTLQTDWSLPKAPPKISVIWDLDGVLRHNNRSLGTGGKPDDVPNTAQGLRAAFYEGRLPQGYYTTSERDVRFRDGALDALKRLKEAGIDCYAITNQEAVGVDVLSNEKLEDIVAFMDGVITSTGGEIKRWYFCTHSPEEQCKCRKPGTKLFQRLADEEKVDLSNAYMVGDNWSDIEAGVRAGCKANLQIILDNDLHQVMHDSHMIGSIYPTDSASSAADWILKKECLIPYTP